MIQKTNWMSLQYLTALLSEKLRYCVNSKERCMVHKLNGVEVGWIVGRYYQHTQKSNTNNKHQDQNIPMRNILIEKLKLLFASNIQGPSDEVWSIFHFTLKYKNVSKSSLAIQWMSTSSLSTCLFDAIPFHWRTEGNNNLKWGW